MLIDTKTANMPTAPTGRQTGQFGRQVEYLLLASLVVVTVALLFAIGLFSPAAAQPLEQEVAAATRLIPYIGYQGQASAIDLVAERHMVIGSVLLSIAAMAAATFGIWRWQLRGLIQQVRVRA